MKAIHFEIPGDGMSWPVLNMPLQNPGSLQNPKHGSDAHFTATPKYPSTKSQTFGSCPYTLKKLYYKMPLYSPQWVSIL